MPVSVASVLTGTVYHTCSDDIRQPGCVTLCGPVGPATAKALAAAVTDTLNDSLVEKIISGQQHADFLKKQPDLAKVSRLCLNRLGPTLQQAMAGIAALWPVQQDPSTGICRPAPHSL
jgi:hypothetical protein